jgi:hypothetical protein
MIPKADLPPQCRNSPVVHPITVEDFWVYGAVSFGPQGFAEEIGSAKPPTTSGYKAAKSAFSPAIDDVDRR